MIKIGLTGPTGAGKSTVAATFLQAGLRIIDADLLARQVTEKGSPALPLLADAFGADIMRADGTLDRQLLAARAFADAEATAKLNAITHPAITELLQRQLRALELQNAGAVVIDAPLLFEAQWQRFCDVTVAVLADHAVRRARIMARDGISAVAADIRMSAQPDATFYTQRVDKIVYNDGDAAALQQHCAALLAEIGGWRV